MMKQIYSFHAYLLPIRTISTHGMAIILHENTSFFLLLLLFDVDIDMCCITFYLDEDIGLHGFNPSLFLSTSKCAFTPRPLIVQPLIAESNQYLLFVNEKPWREGHWDQVVASEV